LRNRLISPGAEFPVIPVEPGIFSFLPEKYRFGTKGSEPYQALADQFPSPAKRGFIGD